MRSHLLTAATFFPFFSHAAIDPRVQVALTLETPCNGVSTTPAGRLFVLYARVDGTQGQGLPEVVEWVNGSGIPYPDATWNSYADGSSSSSSSSSMSANPATTFIRVNSQRIGPDGNLWLVDTGSPGFGTPVLQPAGPKLVVVDVATNRVVRTYGMGNVTLSGSLLDDIRFHTATGTAYLTDAGASGALIVLDLATGRAVRVLDGDVSTGASMPASGEGSLLRSASGGTPQYIRADQLEVSPDGRYLYWQPASGGMSRIETRYLDQALYNSSLAGVLAGLVEPFALTPSTGGTAMDAEGSIYVSDVDRQAIEKVYANGTRTTIVRDERLLWVDAMWISSDKKLWMPAAQLNRGAPFSAGGNSRIVKPLYVYTMDIGVGPSPIDHA